VALKVLLVLVFASALEVGGDALVRIGLGGARSALAAGAATLFFYGLVVNKSGLDFNRLMGVYIAVFFVISQLIAFLIFKQIPDARIMLGGALIISGGLLILLLS
jgi:drug/metabolite transporter superfamily protein YnfA